MNRHAIVLAAVLALVLAAPAAGNARDEAPDTWLVLGEKLEGGAGPMAAQANNGTEAPVKEAPKGDGPPLPLHTIEGVGGGLIVPMAYLVNPGPEGTVVGKPAVSMTFLMLSNKNILTFAISETFFRRIEISYALNRFGLGSMPKAIQKKTGGALKLNRHEVYLHHFNIRGLILQENSFGLPLPAVVIGAQFKVNGGIMGMDETTNGTLRSLGLTDRWGVDFTVHLSKTIPNVLFGRPVILTFGVRNSKASNIGLTGFGQNCETTIELDVATMVTDRLAVGYEFRQKNNPYDRAAGIMEDEDDWHAIRAAYVVNDHLVVAAGWGYFGPVGNTFVNCAWGMQLKYEF